jgi:intron-binding protein aquarius
MNSELEESWRQLATDTWKKPTSRARKVRSETLKESIWDPLAKAHFPLTALALLESLGLLEDYLWPGFTDEAANQHVLLIAMLINAKRRQGLAVWSEPHNPNLKLI